MIHFSNMLLATIYLVLITGSLAQTQTVKHEAGDREVLLECALGGPGNMERCQWTTPLQPSMSTVSWGGRFPKPTPGYRIDADSTGKCNLLIEVIKKEDNGTWTCTSDDVPALEEARIVNLMFVAKPKNILRHGSNDIQGTVAVATPDDNGDIKISCESEGGIPPPKAITWTVNGASVDDLNLIEETNLKTPEEGKPSISTLTVQFPTANQNGADSYRFDSDIDKEREVVCIVHQYAYDTEESPPITATVGRAYKTDKVILNKLEDDKSMECLANGIPAPILTIQMKRGEKWEDVAIIQRNYTSEMIATYRCVATYENIRIDPPSNPIDITIGKNPEDEDDKTKSAGTADQANTGAIVGIVVGALVLLALIGGITMFTFKKRKLCFSGVDRHDMGPGSAENGVQQRVTKPEEKRMVADKKDGTQTEGDQNENMKPKEIVYAELDLAKKNGTNSPQVKSPQQAEKTEYAQIKFQPKENQV